MISQAITKPDDQLAHFLAFFGGQLDERINLVNAETVARSRGFEVREVRGSDTDGYAGLLTVKLRSAEAEHVVEGAVFGKDHPKIVRPLAKPVLRRINCVAYLLVLCRELHRPDRRRLRQ